MSQQPRAWVEVINGQVVLHDPDAMEMINAIKKHACGKTFLAHIKRVRHFSRRVRELGRSHQDTVITLINVDDVHGKDLAEALMPGQDWQQYRDRGEVPFARGLAAREGFEQFLDMIDPAAASKLRDMPELAVVVVDHGTADVYPASLAEEGQ